MKKWMIAILLLLCTMTVNAKEEPEELYAQSAVLMDAESGRVLFEKNGYDVKAMASTTKIMTCILALELQDEDTVVTFSDSAARQPKVHLGAASGEEFYLRDLLYSLMLESHNDSAVAIAEAVAGDTAAFAAKMNQKAKEIGCENTYFITPNGLDASDENGTHSTTATDLSRIMSYCIMESPKKERFLEITQTSAYSFSNLAGSRSYSCTNHNSFLSMMNEAISGKTGYTADAGYCYVGAVESEGRTFVVSLLACGWPNNKNYKWSDMRKLVNYAMENYEYESLDREVELKEIKVLRGIPDSGDLFEEAALSVKLLNESLDTEELVPERLQVLKRSDEHIDILVKQEEILEAPVKEGTTVGTVSYYLEEEKIAEIPIVTCQDADRKDFRWYFLGLMKMYLQF